MSTIQEVCGSIRRYKKQHGKYPCRVGVSWSEMHAIQREIASAKKFIAVVPLRQIKILGVDVSPYC